MKITIANDRMSGPTEIHAADCAHLKKGKYDVGETHEVESAAAWMKELQAQYPDEPAYHIAPCARGRA